MLIRKTLRFMMLALSALAASCIFAPAASGAITAGGLAVVGFSDQSSADDFVLLATTDIAAGEVIYFTNTAWTQTPGQGDFYGVSGGTKSGFQQLMMLTVNETIAKGSIVSTAATSSAFAWTTSGAIGGSGPTNFSKLDLFTTGDQIYIFQSSDGVSPMDVMSSTLDFVYLFDSGEPDFPGFEESTDGYTDGEVPVGLNPNDWTANELDPFGNYRNGSFGFNMALLAPSGTAADWLAAIANESNWTLNELPTTGVNAVPEPSRVMLLGISLGALAFRRGRNVNKLS